LRAGLRWVSRVVPVDSLAGISAPFCGTPADYLSLAASSGIANPDVIYPGQTIRLACDAAPAPEAASAAHHSSGSGAAHRAPGRHARPPPAGPARHAGPARLSPPAASVI